MEDAGFRGALRRDVLYLCVLVFFCDLIAGLTSPTFSLYAKSLGASLVVIGALSSTVGITGLLSSVPLGVLSDRLGRRKLILAGMLVWAASQATFALAPNALALFPGRVLAGWAQFLTFSIGAVLLGDLTTGRTRSYAFGLYASSQGLGFAIGPLIAGAVSDQFGLRAAYMTGSLIALVGFSYGWFTLSEGAGAAARSAVSRNPGWSQVRTVLSNPFLRIGCIGFAMQSLAFGAAVVNFFPLYADKLLITQAAIGTMFSLRAFSSTGARMPMGVVSSFFSPFKVYMVALTLDAVALFGIAQTTSTGWLMVFFALEGIAFGGLMTTAQAYVAEYSTPEIRGTAVGVSRMAGSLSSTLGPLLLGIVASTFGLTTVFNLTGCVIVIGGTLMIISYFRASRKGGIAAQASVASTR